MRLTPFYLLARFIVQMNNGAHPHGDVGILKFENQ